MELIINSFGTSLNRDNEGFVISTSEGRQRVPAEGITSIQISKGAQITSDAVMLAVQLNDTIKIVVENSSIDYNGKINSDGSFNAEELEDYEYETGDIVRGGNNFIDNNYEKLQQINSSANQEYGTVGMLDTVFNLFKGNDSEKNNRSFQTEENNYSDYNSAPAEKDKNTSNYGKYAIGGAILAGIAVAAANEKVRTTVTDTAKNFGNTVTNTTKNIYNKFKGNAAPADNSKRINVSANPAPSAKTVKPKNIVLNSEMEESFQRLMNKNKK